MLGKTQIAPIKEEGIEVDECHRCICNVAQKEEKGELKQSADANGGEENDEVSVKGVLFEFK